MKRLLLALSLGAALVSADAASIDFTYDTFKSRQLKFGYNRAETISVAIFLGPELAGKTVKGISVPVYAQPEKIKDITGWTSSLLERELIDKLAFNSPDGISACGSIGDDHILRVDFSEPAVIPAEGLYAGYTFTATTKLSSTSVATVQGNRKGECYFLSSRAKKTWSDLYDLKKLASAMSVTLDGDFPENDAALIPGSEPALGIDTRTTEITLVNNGTAPLMGISYSYSSDNGISGEGSLSLDKPVEPAYGRGVKIAMPMDAFSETGECNLTVAVTSVNGVALPATKSVTFPLAVQHFVPVFRPLVEEYTYLGCGWCPRGYVMLEQMKALHGDSFVGVSYHSSASEHGAMECIPDKEKPLYPVGGYPTAVLNRGGNTDPTDIPSGWEQLRAKSTTCDVTADFKWDDEEKTSLTATARARFIKDLPEHTYNIAFILIGDELHNSKWRQSNYYYSYEPKGDYAMPFWDLFAGKDEYIKDLEFNDIALAMTDFKGVDESLPKVIEAGKEYEFTYTFEADSIKNLRGDRIVENYDRLRCIALIVDSNTGRVANCASSLYPDGSDPFPVRDDLNWGPFIEEDNEQGDSKVEITGADAEVTASYFLDITGNRVETPLRGTPAIMVEILRNGEIRYSKIIY